VIIPDEWQDIDRLQDLKSYQGTLNRPLKIATKFPRLTQDYFQSGPDVPFEVIQAEGALEIAPTVGYADLIVDLVSTGTTLRDNRLKKLSDGTILEAEACLIANRDRLNTDAATLQIAKLLLEMIVAHLRGTQNLAVFANIRASSENQIKEKIFQKEVIAGLQGPTISRILAQDQTDFYAIHIVVRKDKLPQAIQELREIGGSGVIVSPVNYIFDEQPDEILNMLKSLENHDENS
jgi:ATP phosphoribosyltransferase